MFLELGPSASTTEIARRVGLSQAALFKRFGTKTDLLRRALMPPREPPFLAAVLAGPTDAPIAPQLKVVGKGILAFFHTLIPCMTILRAAGVDHERILKSYDVPPPVRAHGALKGWLERAQALGRLRADVDVSATAMVFLGALQSRAFLTDMLGDTAFMPGGDDDAYIENLIDVLCHGIACEEPPCDD